MAVKIRLTRIGRHKRPLYRVVVADSQSPRDGRFIEILGTYDPLAEQSVSLKVKGERASEWLKRGAKMSDTVRTIFSKCKVLKNAETAAGATEKKD